MGDGGFRRRIDVTTTACLRPEILARTLDSFFENMLGGSAQHYFSYRHILNIDCIGEDCVSYDVIAESIARLGAEPLVRVSEDPCFAKAFRWVWQQVTADYALHLEDDWVLVEPVSLLDMVSFLDAHRDFALLRLNKFESKYREVHKGDGNWRHIARQWNRHMPWNEELGIFEIPDQYKGKLGFSGNPSLLRREFIEECLPYIRLDRWCPEVQLHDYFDDVESTMHRWRFGIWQKQNSRPTIMDIGRVWCEKNRWHKHRGCTFSTWEKINGPTGTDAAAGGEAGREATGGAAEAAEA